MKFSNILLIFLCISAINGQLEMLTGGSAGGKGLSSIPGLDGLKVAEAYVDAILTNAGKILQDFEIHPDYDNKKCDKQLKLIKKSVKNTELWALKVIDSWSKLPSGVLHGNIVEFGNLDECINITHVPEDTSIGIIHGQFCNVELSPNIQKMTMVKSVIAQYGGEGNLTDLQHFPRARVNFCIPEVCHPKAWNKILDSVTSKQGLDVVFGNPLTSKCITRHGLPITWLDIFGWSYFGLVFAIVLAGTFYEMYTRHNNLKPIKYLIAFSAITNTKSLLSFKKSSSLEAIPCLDGIKALGIMGIILGHLLLMHLQIPTLNRLELLDMLHSHKYIFMGYSIFLVDAFFVIGGLLTSFLGLTYLKKLGKLHVPVMYLHRYIRLTIAVSSVIICITTILKHLGTGPFWNFEIGGRIDNCEKEWWHTLIYAGNYIGQSSCPVGIWYLFVDMQLYLFAPLVIYAMYFWGAKFLIAFVPTITAISMASIYYVSWTNNYTFRNLILQNRLMEYAQSIYLPTHTRMSVYYHGVAVGYILWKFKGKEVTIPKGYVILGWSYTTFLTAFLYREMDYLLHDPSYDTLLRSAIYNALWRNMFGIGISWVILACHFGYGGIVNRLFTAPIWRPLSRLCLFLYLTHDMVLQYMAGIQRAPATFRVNYLAYAYFSCFTLTIFVATIFTLLFESPIHHLERLLINKFVWGGKERKQSLTKENFTGDIILGKKQFVLNTVAE